jgi:hypothetical protein
MSNAKKAVVGTPLVCREDSIDNNFSIAEERKADLSPGGGVDLENINVQEGEFANIDEKKVLRKMDLRLIPIVSILYLLCFLDRGNIGNARIEGMTEDLNLKGNEYSIARKEFHFPHTL